jgi:hypothetical protein
MMPETAYYPVLYSAPVLTRIQDTAETVPARHGQNGETGTSTRFTYQDRLLWNNLQCKCQKEGEPAL